MSSNQALIENIVVVGNSGVGKTTAIIKFTNQSSQYPNTTPTVGNDFYIKIVDIQCVQVKMRIWDTAGQEIYRPYTTLPCRSAKGIALFFDVTKRDSFTDLTNWINTLKEFVDLDITPIVIFGNKCDLSEFRTVPKEEACEFADKHNYSYFETSGKTGENLEEAFIKILEQILEFQKSRPEVTPHPTPEPEPNPRKCC